MPLCASETRLEVLRRCLAPRPAAVSARLELRPQCQPAQAAGVAGAETAAAIGVHPTADAALALQQLAQHGFCILNAVIPAADVTALRASAERTAVEHDKGTGRPAHDVVGVFHVTGVLNYDQTIGQWLGHPRVMEVIEAAFATDQIRVSHTTLQVNTPGCKQQEWHADNGLSQPKQWEVAPGEMLRRPAHINTLWMLSDFTPENGATWLVPASHRRPGSETPNAAWSAEATLKPYHEAIHAAAPAGSVLLIAI